MGSFKPKEEIFEKYKIDLPEVLGGAFEILTKVLALKATSTPTASRYPRMAEFAQWGFYIAEALGIGGEAFISAYENNIAAYNKSIVLDNPVTLSLMSLLDKEPEKNGTVV